MMTATERQAHDRTAERRIAGLMAFEAGTLAVMALLHLTGILAGGSKPFDPRPAGVAEMIICVVLAYGAGTLIRPLPRQRTTRVTVGLAILGFIVGLGFTVEGGDAIDLAFHATMLPLLILTLLALARMPASPRSHA